MNPRPLYWSIRRELWENRSIYIAPLTVAAVFLFGFMISTISVSRRMKEVLALDPVKQRHALAVPFSMAASMILMTGFIVAVFYCLDALNGERRDRSILFWKSLPVSDRTTVLSKAIIPLAVLPLVTYTIALCTQLLMLVLNTVAVMGAGLNPATYWARLPLLPMTLVMFYGLTVHALWFAPLYGWLLLVSAWARRAVALWALLPFLAVGIVERLAFGTSNLPAMMKYRMVGAMTEAFSVQSLNAPITRLYEMTPGRFLSTPGLWAGLALCAIFLAIAVRLRRNREPI
jgi:ABC-2 type transport system permease protein